jgi:hypothetical protein
MVKGIVFSAAISTIAIILIAFFVINFIELSRINSINENVLQIYLDSQLLELYENNNDFSEAYCEIISNNISSTNKLLSEMEHRLGAFEGDLRFSQSYVSAKRNYLITNLLLLEKVEKFSKRCDFNVPLLIYFYSEEGLCGPKCNTIVSQLDSIPSTCNYWGFSFPFKSENYLFTQLIEERFGVNVFGTLVIDGKNYSELLQRDELLKKLNCS